MTSELKRLIPFYATEYPQGPTDARAAIWGADGDLLASVRGNLGYGAEAIDVANLIVTAVNAHDRLVAALKEARLHLADYSRRTMYGTKCDDDVKLAQAVITAALALAEQEKSNG